MNCDQVEHYINDFCDNLLADNLQSQVSEHISNCDTCSKKIAQHQDYLNSMVKFKSPELEPGLAARMLHQAKNQPGKSSQNASFYKGFIAASVLFLAIFSSWQFVNKPETITPELVKTEVFSTEVTLVIYVPEDMPNADLKITLPNNVQLAGLSTLSSFSWPVDLKQGANNLSLPIEVAAGTNLHQALSFMANINYNNKQKDFELKVNLVTPHNQT
ncbi:anti-sigma factor family protein [Catenovulum maritimum]|uniref:Zinc-finger domain-containing protein n=1 Tax=Catenovulum maritimum TaxID=1513271 RepID=A0A0J8GT71_9ALTE|nr:zf-HC2 domain-containing protein [Catenovulum maritimum]KMT65980.1 hypothetical protein XM47_05865 [Catenovulum maritimum]